MAKRKKGKVVQMLSPEKYIKQKARTLPIHECLINTHWQDEGLASIIVARQHSNGNFTIGMYLIDLKCLGVKDVQYMFNISSPEYIEICERQQEIMETEKVDYKLVHNIIYAGIEYAEDYGFMPHKDFHIAKYILEEDSDDIEIIEIDCGGEDGNPFYLRGPLDSDVRAAQIINQLEKTAGVGNFTFADGRLGTPYEDKHFNDDYEVVNDDEMDDDNFDLFDVDDLFEEEDDYYKLDFDENKVNNSHTYQFRIQIKGITQPPVWRRITIPSYYTFLHFHYVIQAAFEWLDLHLYSFSPSGYGSAPVIKEKDIDNESFELDSGKILEASETELSEIFTKEGQKYIYLYDFGDNWEHQITLEKIIPEVNHQPNCLDGKGQCPPEDCGGSWGYQNLKEILADKTRPEYNEYHEWLGLDKGETWDEKAFLLEETQLVLSELFKK